MAVGVPLWMIGVLLEIAGLGLLLWQIHSDRKAVIDFAHHARQSATMASYGVRKLNGDRKQFPGANVPDPASAAAQGLSSVTNALADFLSSTTSAWRGVYGTITLIAGLILGTVGALMATLDW